GVGGWLVRHRGAAIMTAPFYSNPSLVEAGTARIGPVPERIGAHLPRVDDVTAILVGHAHYDHLMDVPWIMAERAPGAVVYGNRTMAHQLAPFGVGAARVRVVEAAAGSVEAPGRWISVGDGVRVMPLASDHAPHFAGRVLYAGERRAPMERRPRHADEWLAGRTLAYLVDLLDAEGSTAFRIYYQDAVAAAPYGLPPDLGDGHGVDLALVVPATYAEVRWHPERLLAAADPRHVLLGHWEDFFRPPSEPARPVPFTDLDDFLDRLRGALPDGAGWHLPVPGTRFLFR
ncbi:MAG: MBL fold metallo-hydrolase, partial [Gemmatimonadetes bacterium]|nr:MBL fold metallo-hydrolase [Gemmatimonadota bacterium]